MIILVLLGCGGKKIIRDADTFHVETMAAVARQKEAAVALHAAATAARNAGEWDLCVAYVKPALLIDAYAEAQAARALWLAGLLEGEDPGPSPEPKPATNVCGQKPEPQPEPEPVEEKEIP